MKIKFYGTRGSIPVPGRKTLKYGGNTPCVAVKSGSGDEIILDAGTGIREVGDDIIKYGSDNVYIFLTHPHWDHIQGLPFFKPFYEKKNLNISIYANSNDDFSARQVIDSQLNPKFFPVDSQAIRAKIKYNKLTHDRTYRVGDLRIKTALVHHSKGTLAFKILDGERSVVYMTDNEVYFNDTGKITLESVEELNKELIDFCAGADLLIHDSMYKLRDFSGKKGWGHSNNISAAYLALAAGVEKLVLFHYEPSYSDREIDRIVKETREILNKHVSRPVCIASRENMTIKV